jgi:hypothetical protein
MRMSAVRPIVTFRLIIIVLAAFSVLGKPWPLALASATAGPGKTRIELDRAVIAADAEQPAFVRHRMEDLGGYLREITGAPVPLEAALRDGPGTFIVVGTPLAERALGASWPRDKLGDEGFLIRSQTSSGRTCLVVAGATPAGTKFGVAGLMKMVKVEGKQAFIEGPVDLVSRPAFARRGMHLNGWPIGYPHGFRSWREQDWKRYLDILTCEGVNLFYLWPFMEIMPVPLSKEDEEYLQECRRVVDYAQKQQGMEVWIMQCTNRVARDDCGVRDPRKRPYWRPSQEDLNPGNPAHLQAILKSREAMYRIIDNVDGVCNIDSDPGYCENSPLSDYIAVLRGCREALDRHNIHGKEAKLIHWMWMGWGHPGGRGFEPARQEETIRLLKKELPEPWWLVSGIPGFLPLCRDQGVLSKTVFLPYSVIEDEPSYPATNVAIDGVRKGLEDAIPLARELAGVMGNVQTPLLQFPHVHCYLDTLWDPESRSKPEREVLLDASRLLYPESAELIADSWLALKEVDSSTLDAAAAKLDGIVRGDRLGRPGVLGRQLFPDRRSAADILLAQLKHRAAREKLLETVTPTTDRGLCEALVKEYLDAFLAWELANGWQTLWGWGPPWGLIGELGSDPRFPGLQVKLRTAMGDDAAIVSSFDRIGGALAARHGKRAVLEGCIEPLKNAVLAVKSIHTLAQDAKASASAIPDPKRYPPSAANDGHLETLYWPGALVNDNSEWLELQWDKPATFKKVIVHFLKHPSMVGRTIHLQKQTSATAWEDFATTVIPDPGTGPHAVARFELEAPVTLDRIRIVNLLDLFEVEVEAP